MDCEMDMNEMRRQMEILKGKLEKQQIVNNRIMRRSMKKTVGIINRRNLILNVFCWVMMPLSYWSLVVVCGFSLAFWVGPCVYFLICFGFSFWNGRDLRDEHLLDDNLLEAYRKVARAKRRDNLWMLYGFPMAFLWFSWFAYEASRKGNHAEITALLWGAGVGGFVGLVLGLRIHFRTQRNYRDILDQIEEVTSE